MWDAECVLLLTVSLKWTAWTSRARFIDGVWHSCFRRELYERMTLCLVYVVCSVYWTELSVMMPVCACSWSALAVNSSISINFSTQHTARMPWFWLRLSDAVCVCVYNVFIMGSPVCDIHIHMHYSPLSVEVLSAFECALS